MQRACSRIRQRNPNLFIVDSLFANNEQGAWYDPSDLNTLFQDSAGTVPVTATGQPVGRILDKSGRGNHATQATAGSRPTFRDVDGLRYLEFDGADDFLVTANVDFTATDKVSVFTGMRKLSDALRGMLVELDTTVNISTFGLNIPDTATKFAFVSRGTGAAQAASTTSTAFNAPITTVVTGLASISGPQVTLRAGGAVVGNNVASSGGGNYSNAPLYIGRRGGTTLPFSGNLYGLIVRGVLSDAASISATERYLATKSGVTLS